MASGQLSERRANISARQPAAADAAHAPSISSKARLLGHWGTVPGINMVYAHLSRLIQDTDATRTLIVGPGHGAPGVLANLYLERTLSEVYPEFAPDLAGMTRFVRAFSWPARDAQPCPTALTPGTLHEGGELGYSLAHAFGVALDNPQLLVACLIGDGEAETGPLVRSVAVDQRAQPGDRRRRVADPAPEWLQAVRPDDVCAPHPARAPSVLRGPGVRGP